MAYTYTLSPSQYIKTVSNYTANVTAYDANTGIVTLDKAVNISLGYNESVGDVTSQYNFIGNITNVSTAVKSGTGLPQLSTDEGGNFVGIFNVPAEMFQTGQRVFRVDNRSVPTDPTTATTFAQATFTASGLSTTSQKLEFSPSVDSGAGSFTQVSQRSNELVGTSTVITTTQLARPGIGSFGGCCFIAGTKITLADGSIKNIEDVEIGDKLIGKDKSINTVLAFIRPQLGDRTLVSLNGSVPFMTNDHPVYMKDGTWKSFNPEATKKKYKALSTWNIGKLEVGDIIETNDLTGFKIETISEHHDDEDLQVYNFTLDGNNTYIANDLVVHNKGADPVAQSFIIEKDNFPNGLFIKSIKAFFYSKPKTNIPVKLSVVNTLNGYPNGQVLDHSTVILDANEVVTSKNPHYLDSSTYTEFVFEAPVYIQPGTLYAFILQSASTDYQIYYAQQNSTAVPSTAKVYPTDANPATTSKIGASPYVGALFESQNSITWTADQTKNMMFVIDRCVFDTSKKPTIDFSLQKGLPFRKMGTNDIQHLLDANNVSNLHGNFSNTTWSDAVNLTTTDFTPAGTGINYSYSATLADGNKAIGPYQAFPGKLGSPTPDNIEFDDGQGQRVFLKNSNTSFKMSAALVSEDPNVTPIISDDGVSVYNIRYIINNMEIQNNVISLVEVGAGYDDPANTIATISAPDIGSDQATLGVKVANNGTSNVVSSLYVKHPGSGYITTPTITIYGANTTQATAVVYGETSPKGGNSFAKYFTKKVVLTPENDSGDLRVFYTAYKPLGTRVDVYYKILNRNDTQEFEESNWQLMTQVGNQNAYSQSKTEYIEFECAPGTLGKADNFISYTSETGETYDKFSQFAIKVVMSSDDSTNVPILTDIRALALPSGTGI